ncbi:MAG: helix-turn-helix domain-containing protein [Stellaceae bacterium]
MLRYVVNAPIDKVPSATGQSPALIGKRIRSIRKRVGLTLEQVSEQTGLNKGYLSRIESGEKSPSIATLLKLSSELKVPASQLFGEEIDDDDIHLFRSGAKGGELGSEAPELISLSGNTRPTSLAAFLLQPSDNFEEEKRAEHSGTEGAFVIAGDIELQFSDRVIPLSQGDYVQFPGHLTHQIRRTSPQATVLIVMSEA